MKVIINIFEISGITDDEGYDRGKHIGFITGKVTDTPIELYEKYKKELF